MEFCTRRGNGLYAEICIDLDVSALIIKGRVKCRIL